MYELHDTFNDRIISRHRSMIAAGKAGIKHDRMVKRANGANSYIPTEVRIDGRRLTEEETEEFYNTLYDLEFNTKG